MEENTPRLPRTTRARWMNECYAYCIPFIAEKAEFIRSYHAEIGTLLCHLCKLCIVGIPSWYIHSSLLPFVVNEPTFCMRHFSIPTVLIAHLIDVFYIGRCRIPPNNYISLWIDSTLSASVRRWTQIIASRTLQKQITVHEITEQVLSSRRNVPKRVIALISDSLCFPQIQELSSEKQVIKVLSAESVLSSKAIALILSYTFHRERYVIPSIDGRRMVRNVASTVSIRMDTQEQQRLMRDLEMVRLK